MKLIREEFIDQDFLLKEQIKKDLENKERDRSQVLFPKIITSIKSKSLKSLLFKKVEI